jgi:hypothetical protein
MDAPAAQEGSAGDDPSPDEVPNVLRPGAHEASPRPACGQADVLRHVRAGMEDHPGIPRHDCIELEEDPVPVSYHPARMPPDICTWRGPLCNVNQYADIAAWLGWSSVCASY